MAHFLKSLSYSRRLLILLSGLFCFRLLYALLLPLSPQEAYYWVFSLHPALSYFDHPPLTAYTIYLLPIFGPDLAVRLGALLCAFGFLVSLRSERMFNEPTVSGLTTLPTFHQALILTSGFSGVCLVSSLGPCRKIGWLVSLGRAVWANPGLIYGLIFFRLSLLFYL
jgi:hypothetical protein